MDTGKQVASVKASGTGKNSSGGIDVWFFDGKYRVTVSRYETALGFVLRVEAVLNHMTHLDEQNSISTAA